jgi:predicted Zn-dependent protease
VAAESNGAGKHGDPAESSLFTQGEQFLLRGDYPQAAGVFQAGTERYPLSQDMFVGLGITYYAGRHFDQAAKTLCKAVDLDPADPRPYFFLAEADWSSLAESAPVLQRLHANATRHPRDAAAQYFYAVALWRARTLNPSASNPAQVEQLLRSAIALDDSLAEAHFELGVVLSTTKENEAITEFKRTLDLQPDWAEAHYRLGQLYQHTGAQQEAQKELSEYERLHQRDPVEQQRRLRDEVRRLLGSDSSGQARGLAAQEAGTAAPR